MKFSENWLRQWVDIKDVGRDTLKDQLTLAGLEVETVIAPYVDSQRPDPFRVGQIVSFKEENIERNKKNRKKIIKDPYTGKREWETGPVQSSKLKSREVYLSTSWSCKVNIGDANNPVTIRGVQATHLKEGMKVLVALPGAPLPPDDHIKAENHELLTAHQVYKWGVWFGYFAWYFKHTLPAEHDLFELHPDAEVGTDLGQALCMTDDACFDLKLTPNRADCLSMKGLAHEVAALCNKKVKNIDKPAAVVENPDAKRAIYLAVGASAPRYLGRIIEGLDLSTCRSPQWLLQRLFFADLPHINLVVDVTHYVMLELGQPMHAFDNEKIQGDITVRYAQGQQDELKLLDGNTVDPDHDFILIADEEKPLAIAGVMGGYATRVTDKTRQIWLEAAHFTPAAIMGKARRLGLDTEASRRFERGVDPDLPSYALERASALIEEIAGGRAGPVCEAELQKHLPVPMQPTLRRTRLQRVLGLTIASDQVSRILSDLGMDVTPVEEGWKVKIPGRRFDITYEEDLIEEVARIVGYDKIPTVMPAGTQALAMASGNHLAAMMVLRQHLVSRDYFEAMSLPFVSSEKLLQWTWDGESVELTNPLSADFARMRPSLLPGLVDSLHYNAARQLGRIRLFEIARTFTPSPYWLKLMGKTHEKLNDDEEWDKIQLNSRVGRNKKLDNKLLDRIKPVETPTLALVACGEARAGQWGEASRALDFFDLKGELEALIALGGQPEWKMHADNLPSWLHPGRGARVTWDGEHAGYFGALHPQCAQSLDLKTDVYVLELRLEPLLVRRVPKPSEISSFPSVYPSVRRDLNVEVPDKVRWEALEKEVKKQFESGLALQGLDVTGSNLMLHNPDRYKSSSKKQIKEHYGLESQGLKLELALMDFYRDEKLKAEGYKRMTISLILQHESRTLSDLEVNLILRNLKNSKSLKDEFKCRFL